MTEQNVQLIVASWTFVQLLFTSFLVNRTFSKICGWTFSLRGLGICDGQTAWNRYFLTRKTPWSPNLWLMFLPWFYVCADIKQIPCTSRVPTEFDPFGLTEHGYKTFGTSCGYWTFCSANCSEHEQRVNSVHLTPSEQNVQMNNKKLGKHQHCSGASLFSDQNLLAHGNFLPKVTWESSK